MLEIELATCNRLSIPFASTKNYLWWYIVATDSETEGVFVHTTTETEVTWLNNRWGCHSVSYTGHDYLLLGIFSSSYPEDTGKWCDWIPSYSAHFICEALIWSTPLTTLELWITMSGPNYKCYSRVIISASPLSCLFYYNFDRIKELCPLATWHIQRYTIAPTGY